ncbi:hypothetical protein VH567_10935 [Sphingomonas sp. 4RDLI-65]|uniref:hypothetical protein n=1 Tax=Sphingomonas sp. 4RDLI-65 TaxID=3111641 RepID=UPI003C1485E0
MTPYNFLPDYAEVRGDDIFYRACPGPRDNDATYLLPGQTEWFGPFPTEGEDEYLLRWHRRWADADAKRAACTGIHLQVQTVGALIRTHRLAEGPAKKLSDWKQLTVGRTMLVDPHPDDDRIERATTRVRYMRHKGFGDFRTWTDADGALWVERL